MLVDCSRGITSHNGLIPEITFTNLFNERNRNVQTRIVRRLSTARSRLETSQLVRSFLQASTAASEYCLSSQGGQRIRVQGNRPSALSKEGCGISVLRDKAVWALLGGQLIPDRKCIDNTNYDNELTADANGTTKPVLRESISWIQRYKDLEELDKIWRFPSIFFASLLSVHIGSQPGTNGVGMGFHHRSLEVEFLHAPDPPRGQPAAVWISSGIYEAVRGHMRLDLYFLFFSSYIWVWQPWGSAAREDDEVRAAGPWPSKCPGYSHCAGVPIALQRLSYYHAYWLLYINTDSRLQPYLLLLSSTESYSGVLSLIGSRILKSPVVMRSQWFTGLQKLQMAIFTYHQQVNIGHSLSR
jgi:hypothetical protein